MPGRSRTTIIAKSNYDQAVARIAQINAQEAQARATLANARYQLSERDVVSQAPSAGWRTSIFRTGEYVPASTPVVSMLPPKNVYVRFFVPETEFAQVQAGPDGRDHLRWLQAGLTATITFIAAQEEFTPPVIFRVGNREKLVFKLEARAPGGLTLHPGQPVRGAAALMAGARHRRAWPDQALRPARSAVDHIDIAVPEGEVWGFLGPNGSGKTTTIRMLCGLLRADDGQGTCLGLRLPHPVRSDQARRSAT